jgi:hypothetical protein
MIHDGLYHTFVCDDFEKFRFITQLFWFLSTLTFLLLAPIVFLVFEHLFLMIRKWDEQAKKTVMYGSFSLVFMFISIFLALKFGVNFIYFGWILMATYFAAVMLRGGYIRLQPPKNEKKNMINNLLPGALLGAVVPIGLSVVLSLFVILPSAYSLIMGKIGLPIYNLEIKIVALTVMLILFDAFYISSGVVGAIFATLINSIEHRKENTLKKRIIKRRGKKR